jgi:DNA-binding transcriptional regulator GbsR (MarR family)
MTPPRTELDPIVHRFIEDAGSTTQALGLGRVVGQIYAYLYFSPEPRNLADLQDTLGISKGSASTCVRQLEQWGAVRKIWIKGDRKDYYEANDWLGKILRSIALDTIGKKILAYASLLDDMEGELQRGNDGDAFVRERIQHLRQFEKRARKVWDSKLLKMLLE